MKNLFFLEYILLEDVTARFRHPCILDLKMGKRQYADVDSDIKRQSKIQKCESSTSSTLGVRLCGMQVVYSSFYFSSAYKISRKKFHFHRSIKVTVVDTFSPINIADEF